MPYSSRTYLIYVDDSGNENVGWLWTALALPTELWTDHLRRWLAFRRWLYNAHAVPASFELHAQVWLSPQPEKHIPADELALVRDDAGELLEVVRRGRAHRRARFEIFEKAIKTIGSFPDARLFTTYTPTATGAAKLALYDDLLCFLEDFLIRERSHGMLVVDGLQDNGGHLRASHRALSIAKRRVVEDASHRRSSDSQLLQMADCCAYAALQSIQAKATLDIRFREQYQRSLTRVIARPADVEAGRCIRGLDYPADQTGCPSERAAPATSS
jgi:hypothetical protein